MTYLLTYVILSLSKGTNDLKGDITMKYQVIIADSWKVIAKGFRTMRGAADWAYDHDFGQYEEDGGLRIMPYTEEEQ